ncbi:thiamine-phosphate kinase [bacterium]|nr:thiamine-phosphate kinase [candidate division CSSED10-310 bacterium]
MKKNSLSEFQLIERFLSRFPEADSTLIVPPGDDCAVFRSERSDPILVTTDLLIEDVHFTMDSIRPRELGIKSMAVNLSDIAAMGAEARYAFLSMGFRKAESLDVLDGVMSGIREMCNRYAVYLAGGDTTLSRKHFVINICIIGFAPAGRFLTRSGAQPGDVIQISGPLGGSAAALSLILKKKNPRDFSELARAHFTPEPRLATGQALNRLHGVHSMIDISDGLIQDLGHICEMSRTGAHIYAERIPLFPDASNICDGDMRQVYSWALAGGEDYELCWTVSPDMEDIALDAARNAGAPNPVTIGTVTDGSDLSIFKNGKAWLPDRTGWDHFKT